MVAGRESSPATPPPEFDFRGSTIRRFENKPSPAPETKRARIGDAPGSPEVREGRPLLVSSLREEVSPNGSTDSLDYVTTSIEDFQKIEQSEGPVHDALQKLHALPADSALSERKQCLAALLRAFTQNAADEMQVVASEIAKAALANQSLDGLLAHMAAHTKKHEKISQSIIAAMKADHADMVQRTDGIQELIQEHSRKADRFQVRSGTA